MNHLMLKASLSVIIALFSTTLSEDFRLQYETAEKSEGVNTSTITPCRSWMAKIVELAEMIQLGTKPELGCSREMSLAVKDAALKSAVAISTLFDSRDQKINRFMKKLTCRYNDKHAKKAAFYTMVVMVSLCLFPYLKHRVLGDLFNHRTLVIMCFDKTRTRHNQWSTLSTQIHLHVRQRAFVQRVMSYADPRGSLPVVVTATLDKYFVDASFHTDMSLGQAGEHLETCSVDHQTDNRVDSRCDRKQKTNAPRKRTTPCTTGYYESHQGRQEEKVMRLQHS